MLTLRCTRKLLAKLKALPSDADAPPTTALGDWYANVFNHRHARMAYFLSQRSLLSVLVPIRRLEHLVPAFREGLEELLLALDLPRGQIDAELQLMQQWSVGHTASRSVLASMRDLTLSARSYMDLRPWQTLLQFELELAGTPCGPLPSKFPDLETRKVLADRHAGTV